MKDKLTLPYQRQKPESCTDALHDMYIRSRDLINFVGEVLVSRELSNGKLKESQSFNLELKTPSVHKVIEVPQLEVDSKKWNNLIEKLPRQLFFSSIMRLATTYESYLHEIFREIFWRNFDLVISEEKQLSTEEIFNHEDLKEIQETLIERKIHNLLMKSYPKLVKSCSKIFKTEFHGSKSPMSLFEIHDFLETRNVVAHNDGYASDLYFQRLKEYDSKTFIPKSGGIRINFKWLFSMAENFIEMCSFLDEQLTRKWETSKN